MRETEGENFHAMSTIKERRMEEEQDWGAEWREGGLEG